MEVAVLCLYVFEFWVTHIFDRYFEKNHGPFGKPNVKAAQKANICFFFLVWKQGIHNGNPNSLDWCVDGVYLKEHTRGRRKCPITEPNISNNEKSGENQYSLGIIRSRVKMKETPATVVTSSNCGSSKSVKNWSSCILGCFSWFTLLTIPLVGRIARDYCCNLSVDVSLDGKIFLTWWLICNNCSCFESCPELSFINCDRLR